MGSGAVDWVFDIFKASVANTRNSEAIHLYLPVHPY